MKCFVLSLFLFFALRPKVFSKDVNIIFNGKSDYKIFVSEKASKPEKYAAAELQKYIQLVSGCKLPVTKASTPTVSIPLGTPGGFWYKSIFNKS
jgi:hypothetical protein